MFKNYLVTTCRNVLRNPVYFLINFIGMSIGITGCLMIFLFVNHELSFDHFHSRKDRLFRLNYNSVMAGNQTISPSVPVFVAPHLKRLFPEIEDATRFESAYSPMHVRFGENKMFEENNFAWADSNFFKLLDFKGLKGDLTTALNRPKTLVITESIAKKYFGESDPVGQTLTLGSKTPYEVTAVIEDVPSNSHFSFDLLTSMYSQQGIDDETIRWNDPNFTTFLLINPSINIVALQTKINNWVNPQNQLSKQTNSLTLDLEPLTKVHFNSIVHNFQNRLVVTDIKYLYIFIAIGILLLAIACINYINLSTATASTRAKEVGVRKTSGANFRTLMLQYLSESFLLLLPAVLLSFVTAKLSMPGLNFLLGKKIEYNLFNLELLTTVAAGWIVVSLLAGFYPALVLSRVKTISALRGKAETAGGLSLRKTLVIVQLMISSMLVSGTLIVFSQLKFMQSKKLGLNTESVLYIRSNADLQPNLQAFIQKLGMISGVENACATWRSPFQTVVGNGFNLSPNPENDDWLIVGGIAADHQYLETMGMKLIAGRNFDPAKARDTINEFIVNEAFLRNFGVSKDEAIGKQVTLGIVMERGPGTIIGIVEDFHITSLHKSIKPVVLFNNPEWLQGSLVRLSPGNPQTILRLIEKEWKAFVPKRPFNFSFLDDEYDALYRTEQRLGKLAGIFSSVSIVVACLGLLGLAYFTSHQRTKEISIRKVLGATTVGVVILLSRGYMKLLMIAFLIAVPVSYFLLDKWLENFAFRINIGPAEFIVALVALMTVSGLTIGYQSLRAASTNPADNLRRE